MRADVDRIARHLGHLAAQARALPPSFAGCGERIPMRGPSGEWLGHMLPGTGISVDLDLDRVGIRKSIPFVYERSPVQRFLDRGEAALRRIGVRDLGMLAALGGLAALDVKTGLAAIIGAITTYDGIIAARAGGKADDVAIVKNSFTTSSAAWFSSFRAGGMPASGTYANSPGAALNATNPGAFSLGLTAPTGGDTKYLLSFGFGASSASNWAVLVDILYAAGNLNAATNTTQTIGTSALTRYTTGSGVFAAVEVTSAFGATPANLTISYTNQAGTAGQTSTSVALTTSALAQQLLPASQLPAVPLASGDYGVRAIASCTLSASMGSGNFAIVLYKILTVLPGVGANTYVERDSPTNIDGILQLPTEAGGALGCLALFLQANTVSSGTVAAWLKTCAG